jgi:hypothetical protein
MASLTHLIFRTSQKSGTGSCEIIMEKAKTLHAKAQRRKGNKAIILCDL